MFWMGGAGIFLGSDCLNPHHAHQPLNGLVIYRDSLPVQCRGNLGRSVIREFGVDLVNAAHEVQFSVIDRYGRVVVIAAIEVYKIALADNGNVGM